MRTIKPFGTAVVLTILCALSAVAQNQVVVIPLSGSQSKPLQNVITVAKQNGDYTDPVQAVSDILDASAANPYLVVIAPGVYSLTATLVMKEYVSVAGAGQNATFLIAPISTQVGDSSSAIIAGSSYATLSDLSVTNTGGSAFAYAVYNKDANLNMERITATVTGATNNYGVYNRSSSPTMIQVTATASEGSMNYGVSNLSSAPTIYQLTANASGGTTDYGVENFSITSILTIRGSFLSGSTAGIHISDPRIRVIDTRISGGVVDDDPGTQCRNTYDVNLGNVDC